MSEFDMKQNALELAARGFKVFPVHGIIIEDEGAALVSCTCEDGLHCENKGKHPVQGGWQKGATADPRRIGLMDWAGKNVGILCENLVVLDVDPRNDGLRTLDWLEGVTDDWPQTLRVRTGSGGWHYYWTGDRRTAPNAWDGIDIKAGTSSLVVGPGSLHASGNRYEIFDHYDLAPAPQWVMEQHSSRESGDDAMQLTEVGEGGRDNYLTQVAGVLRRRNFDTDEIEAALLVRNRKVCVPPLPEEDVIRIAQSVGRYDPDEHVFEREMHQEQRKAKLLEDRLTVQQILNMPPPSWVIKDVWPKGGVNVLYGQPGCGKSFVALDWCLHRALGRDWLRKEVKERTRVLYVAAEGAYGMGARLRAWMKVRGVAPEELSWFELYPHALNLLKGDDVKVLWEIVHEEEIGLVVYDTLRKSMAGGDENSTQEAGQLMTVLEEFANSKQSPCDSLLIHHGNKGERGDFRGSSTIKADSYNIWKATKMAPAQIGEPGMTVKLEAERFKDAPETTHHIALDVVETGEFVDGVPETSLVPTALLEQLAKDVGDELDSTQRRDALLLVQSHGDGECSKADLAAAMGEAFLRGKPHAQTGKRYQNTKFDNAFNYAQERGWVTWENGLTARTETGREAAEEGRETDSAE